MASSSALSRNVRRREVVPSKVVVQDRDGRVEVGGIGAEGDQHVHVGPPGPQGPNRPDVEPAAPGPELHGRRQAPFQQLVQGKAQDHLRHQVPVEFREEHRHDHRDEVDWKREQRRVRELVPPPPHVRGDGRSGPGAVGADGSDVAGHARDLGGGPNEVSRARGVGVESHRGRGRPRVDVHGRDAGHGEESGLQGRGLRGGQRGQGRRERRGERRSGVVVVVVDARGRGQRHAASPCRPRAQQHPVRRSPGGGPRQEPGRESGRFDRGDDVSGGRRRRSARRRHGSARRGRRRRRGSSSRSGAKGTGRSGGA